MEIENKSNMLIRVKHSFHTVCSFLDVKSLTTLRETNSEIKNLVDFRIAKLLLRNKRYSGISFNVSNMKMPVKSTNYMQLYSELLSSEIRSKIDLKKLRCSYASSIDYSQTPENLLDGNKNTFWGSKGHDTPLASEFTNFCHEDGLLLDIKSMVIGFYRESDFEDGFDFFPSDEIIIRVGLFEHKFDHEYGPFNVKEGLRNDDKIEIKLDNNKFLAKYFQIEFKGKPGLQKQDNKYYHAIGSLELEGHQFDIEKGSGQLTNILEAYYEKQDFIENTVSAFYKTTFPSLYSDVIRDNLEKLSLQSFILGNGDEIIQKLHKPTIDFMLENGYELETVFEYLNKSMVIKQNWDCMKFLDGKEILDKYVAWITSRYGIMNQIESRLIVSNYFYKRFFEEFGEERRVDKDRFNEIVSP